jgi:hypothetical protein
MTAVEVIAPLDPGSSERLDRRIRLMADTIRDNIAKLTGLIEEAKQGQIHVALGFASWTAYLADALGGRLELDTDSRREVVALMSGEGMSQRAIAQAVGVSQKTVDRDLDKGTQVSHGDSPDDDRCLGCNVNRARRGDCLCSACFNLEAQIHGTPLLPRSESPEPLVVTGLDGKTYTAKTPKKAPSAKQSNLEKQRKAISRALNLTDQVREASGIKGLDPGIGPEEAARCVRAFNDQLGRLLVLSGLLVERAETAGDDPDEVIDAEVIEAVSK